MVFPDRTVRVAVACVALVVVSCGSAAGSGPGSARTSPRMEAGPSGLRAGVSTCDDELDDAVAFDGGAPTTQRADADAASRLERVGLESDGETFTVWLSPRGEYDVSPPPDDIRVYVHLQSLHDPARTGSVQIGFRANREPDAWDVLAGPRGGPMVEVGIVDDRIWRGRSAGGGGEVTIAADRLPVSPPFRWYVTSQKAGEPNAGDVCPNVTGFTGGQPLPVFPRDANTTARQAGTAEITEPIVAP